jgi:enoyl-CoA hydratase
VLRHFGAKPFANCGFMRMNFSDYKAIEFRRDGHVLHATFNRPDTMNAVDDVLQHDLDRLFLDVAEDDKTHVLVITGAGPAFSAGGNVDSMQKLIDNPHLFRKEADKGKQRIFAMLDCPKPIIAKVNGAAIGLGATIALFCDIVFAAEHAKIADPHVQVGLTAGDGGAVIWPALLGYARARHYLFTGEAITGAEAARIGLIYKAVPAETLDKVADEYAQRLANGASHAIQGTKLSANIGLKHLAQQILDASFAYELMSQQTKDHQEAANAFREKRKPRFSGA